MNKTTRMFAMTGLAVAAGLTMGVGPASAAPATPSATTTAAAKADHRGPQARDRVVGFYRNPMTCVKTGKVGEFRKKWVNFDCDQVRRGLHRGQWALTVSWDRRSPFRHGVHHVIPQHNIPQHNIPQHNIPQHNMPHHNIPQHQAPQHQMPRR